MNFATTTNFYGMYNPLLKVISGLICIVIVFELIKMKRRRTKCICQCHYFVHAGGEYPYRLERRTFCSQCCTISSKDRKPLLVMRPPICVICLDDLNGGAGTSILQCNHKFHGTCLSSWLKRKQRCPLCRRNILDQDVVGHSKAEKPPFWSFRRQFNCCRMQTFCWFIRSPLFQIYYIWIF